MYRDGDGVPEDDAEAARWYRLAADQGHAPAQFNLGLMHATGEGVPDVVLQDLSDKLGSVRSETWPGCQAAS
jgi:TPR repeat protein